jgi:di/tricarboxylate transporter
MAEQMLAGLILVGLLGALIFTRWPTVWVFVTASIATYFLGLTDTQTLLVKLTNEGLVTLVLLLLLSVGLERLPWLTVLNQRLVVPSLSYTLLRLAALVMPFSALINNTAVVATLAGTLRKNRHHSASQILLPLSYVAILGGTLTLIGTSTNLIVSSFLQDASGVGLSFFALFPVALPAVLASLVAIVVGRRLLPRRDAAVVEIAEYLIETRVADDSRLIGRTIQENGLRDLGDLFLVEIIRGGDLLSPVAPTQRVAAGDKLIFTGDITQVGLLERFHGLRLFASDEGLLRSNMTEVVVMPTASVAGQTIKEAGFRSRFDAAVVGLRRDGARLSGKLGTIRLKAGDSLMLAVGPDFAGRSNLRKNFLVVDDAIETTRLSTRTSILVTLGLAAVVLLAAGGWVPLLQSVLGLLLLMLVLQVVSVDDLRRRFPFDIWLIIASALTVSQAMYNTGLVGRMVEGLEPLLMSIPPYGAVIAVYCLTLLMTELMTNNAAAALVFPLAYTLGISTGSDPLTFVMAVAFGASASFLTPFGYTTNLMVQNLGGYQRKDYLRFGLPVSLTYSTVVLVVLPWIYPL